MLNGASLDTVATLVVKPDCPVPLAEILDLAADALSRRGAAIGEPLALSPHAADLPFARLALGEARRTLGRALAVQAVDHAVQKRAERRKRLLVSDMDSTMVAAECIDEIADFAGRKAEIAQITEAAMRGELDFEEALRQRVRALAGLDAGILARVADERAPLMPGARPLIATMRRSGARCVLVSGGFTRITERIAARLGIEAHHANVLKIERGRLTGELAGEIVDAAAKARILENHCRELGIETSAALAIGDGANDIAMMRSAGFAVAYRAKPAAVAAADAEIRHTDLVTALYFQGFSDDEIVGR